ncbi:MAG: hypothetical protein Terrestrivirus2_169 [Terrestrivirus sp.]|uniref:Uncharacterized protein n=1 Tax=Terrestrivirus sp. TaxID=2487775 RepID=A0A3G4ZNV9_9VIRU|nr:MAG: hypothetical protein Terrestrivirus2_169 [Terrestrivirus sp.]
MTIYNIYNSEDLLYPLDEDEIEQLDNTWNFLKKFQFNTIGVTEYRKKIINKISKSIDKENFYSYEKIAEKMMWNLRDKVKYLFNECSECIDHTEKLNETGLMTIMGKFYDDNSYRSYINKLILIDDNNDKIHYKKMEGSSCIFNQNKMNETIWIVMTDKNLYEKIIKEPKKIQLVDSPNYYHGYDYGLPNLNFGKPFIQSDSYRLRRIEKMYYDKNAENNWFKLIR